jgi:hypothetical protein
MVPLTTAWHISNLGTNLHQMRSRPCTGAIGHWRHAWNVPGSRSVPHGQGQPKAVPLKHGSNDWRNGWSPWRKDMKIQIEIKVYEINGKETSENITMRVQSHWSHPNMVEITVGENRITVLGNDLRKAVERCTWWGY